MRKSVGRKFLVTRKGFLLSWILLAVGVASCTVVHHRESEDPNSPAQVAGEQSLKADSKAIEDLRRDIPPEKKQENDELKIILNLMVDGKQAPNRVRQRFDQLMRKRRKDHRRSVRTDRDQFKRTEKRQKDDFLKKLKAERTSFKRGNADRDKTRQFYAELDLKRRDYFSAQRDRRRDFETEKRQRSKDFESNMKEWKKEFTQEHRIYSRTYRETQKKKKAERAQRLKQSRSAGKKTPSAAKASGWQKEFEDSEKIPSTSMGAGDDDK